MTGAENESSVSRKRAHDYLNARQSLVLMDHARRKGLMRSFETGLAHLGDVEKKLCAYRPTDAEAEEHAALLRMIAELKIYAIGHRA